MIATGLPSLVSILRARGGSSQVTLADLVNVLYSPRTRR